MGTVTAITPSVRSGRLYSDVMTLLARSSVAFLALLALAAPAHAQRLPRDSATRVADSLRKADFEKRLAAARSRPRHWNCDASAEEVRAAADSAYDNFPGSDAEGLRRAAREYGMPAARRAFLRDFRAIRSAEECRLLGEALDKQIGLVDDAIRVYRTGKVYYLPGYGYGGMIVGLDRKIIGIYIVPN